VDQGGGDLGALLVAERQLLQLLAFPVAEAEAVQQRRGPGRASALDRPCS
jgi:hypothetical protein